MAEGGFMHKENVLAEFSNPRKKLSLPKLNFQMTRRSAATLALSRGTVKDVQSMLRHTTPDVTLGTYTQPIAESVRQTVSDTVCRVP
jgi:integrase